MADAENHTLRLLQELRAAIKEQGLKLERLDNKIDRNHDDLRSRMDNLRQALNGESILGRYAVAEVDERPDAIEKRLSKLEKVR